MQLWSRELLLDLVSLLIVGLLLLLLETSVVLLGKILLVLHWGLLVTVVLLVWGRGPLMHLGKVRERLRVSLVFLVDVRVPLLLRESVKVSVVLLVGVRVSLLFPGRLPFSLVLLELCGGLSGAAGDFEGTRGAVGGSGGSVLCSELSL